MKNASFWENETFNREPDLIIIGAGIVGLSSALFYKNHHPEARVLVLDKGNIPEGASTRNAGFACVGSITEHVADMQKETEANIKRRLQWRYRGLQLLRNTLGDEAIGYENCGGYELFTDKDSFETAREFIPKFNSWLSELSGFENVYQPTQLNGYSVIKNKLEGALHPGKMMQSLIHKVMTKGVAIRWNTRVESITDKGSIVLQNGDALQAKQVLAATNGFTKSLLGTIDVSPARGLVMVSEPWGDIPWRGTFNYDRGYVYFRNVGDRLLLGGGRNVAKEQETLQTFGTNDKVQQYLQKFARQTLKMPDELSFEYEWSGIMGFTESKTPVVERVNNHQVVAAGLSGMGIAIGMEVGKQAAEILTNE